MGIKKRLETAKNISITLTHIENLLKSWHKAGRENWNSRHNEPDNYDKYYCKHIDNRKKYICLNEGESGVFVIDKTTGDIFLIKGYGVPNRKKPVGHINTITGG